MALRAIPNLTLLRPADANEAVQAWAVAVQHTDGPTAMALTRQALPVLPRDHGGADGVRRGAYVLRACEGTPDVILIGTGSEVQHALGAAEQLEEEGRQAQVVSMPSWELFASQPTAYRHTVLPPEVEARVSVEAGITQGWERYVGTAGTALGIDRFGASAPGTVNMERFGFTADHVADAARALLA
jgi:transketolase